MTLAELKKGLLTLMKSVFPENEYHYYSMDVMEDYDRPCFFTTLKPVDTDPANYNSRNNIVTFYIDYFQEEVDELNLLNTIDKLRDLFGLFVNIEGRAVKTSGFEWDFVGAERYTAEIKVDFQWMDRIEHVQPEEMIESVYTNTEMED